MGKEPELLQPPSDPVVRVVRDELGKIVEYDAGPQPAFKVAPKDPPKPVPLTPKTMQEVAANYVLTKRLIDDSFRALISKEHAEAAKEIGPAVSERDKVVSAARRDLNQSLSLAKRDEDAAVVLAVRSARAAHAKLRKTIEAEYDRVKAEAHDRVNDVVSAAERRVEARAQQLKAVWEKDLKDLNELRKKQEADVRAADAVSTDGETAVQDAPGAPVAAAVHAGDAGGQEDNAAV